MTANLVSVGRLVLIITTLILALISLLITVIAVATPNWQVVYMVETHIEHYHGLWLDCVVRKLNPLQRINKINYSVSPVENSQCTYKFENADFFSPMDDSGTTVQNEDLQHKFLGWHKAVLTFFAIAIICAVAAFCFSLCAACVRVCAIASNVLYFLAFISDLTALIVFFINSHRIDIRFVHGITMTHEQTKGYSFYLSIFGVMGLMLTFTVSVLATVLIFVHDSDQHRQQKRKTFPKEATVTSINV